MEEALSKRRYPYAKLRCIKFRNSASLTSLTVKHLFSQYISRMTGQRFICSSVHRSPISTSKQYRLKRKIPQVVYFKFCFISHTCCTGSRQTAYVLKILHRTFYRSHFLYPVCEIRYIISRWLIHIRRSRPLVVYSLKNTPSYVVLLYLVKYSIL
jgi:hypothetical protein